MIKTFQKKLNEKERLNKKGKDWMIPIKQEGEFGKTVDQDDRKSFP